MKTVVVYKSTYGTTKAYAEAIAARLNADLLPAGRASLNALKDYDALVYGGGIYAGRIAGGQRIARYFRKLTCPRVAVFSVGFTPASRGDILEAVRGRSFGKALQKSVAFFHFPGPLPMDGLTPLHRLMLAGRRLFAKKQGAPGRKEKAPLPLERVGPLIDFMRGPQ